VTAIETPEEARGFNLPERHRLWRDGLVPRSIIPLFWIYWLLLLPSWVIGLPRLRANRKRPAVVAIESGKLGWTHVFFEELGWTADEFFGEGSVKREVIDRDKPYIPQFLENVSEDNPTHLVLDVRTCGQTWRKSLLQAFRVTWHLNRTGVTPIVFMTDAFFRRQRWQSAVLTAFRGVVITYADKAIVCKIFPHRRILGPMFMPISERRLDWLEQQESEFMKSGDVVQFIGSVYPPRSLFLDAAAERLEKRGIRLRVNSDKTGTSNEDYWFTLVEADVVLTTTLQGPDRPFMDWVWTQQAVFRFIETMASGSALVASRVPGIESYFSPGDDFLEFQSVNEGVTEVERLVRDPELRERIARNGHDTAAALIRSKAFWNTVNDALGINRVNVPFAHR
jgi:glycosyltransferase involved in cell wall biosynthesis